MRRMGQSCDKMMVFEFIEKLLINYSWSQIIMKVNIIFYYPAQVQCLEKI